MCIRDRSFTPPTKRFQMDFRYFLMMLRSISWVRSMASLAVRLIVGLSAKLPFENHRHFIPPYFTKIPGHPSGAARGFCSICRKDHTRFLPGFVCQPSHCVPAPPFLRRAPAKHSLSLGDLRPPVNRGAPCRISARPKDPPGARLPAAAAPARRQADLSGIPHVSAGSADPPSPRAGLRQAHPGP